MPGIYVGANIKNQGRSVTGLELFTSFKSGHYWRSRSAVPNVEIRGYQMIQLFPQTKDLLDIKIDINVTQNDYKHDTVRWLRAPIG